MATLRPVSQVSRRPARTVARLRPHHVRALVDRRRLGRRSIGECARRRATGPSGPARLCPSAKTRTARVTAVWEGIQTTHGAPLEQAAPLMPPMLDNAIAACPRTRRFRNRDDEPDLAVAHDRALLLLGFSGRCAGPSSPLSPSSTSDWNSSCAAAGAYSPLPRSHEPDCKDVEPVGISRAEIAEHCPITALDDWLTLAAITTGPVLRKMRAGATAPPTPPCPRSL